jgi:hypothetical protein
MARSFIYELREILQKKSLYHAAGGWHEELLMSHLSVSSGSINFPSPLDISIRLKSNELTVGSQAQLRGVKITLNARVIICHSLLSLTAAAAALIKVILT